MRAASLAFTRTLYATLCLVPFLRRLGARTGRWSEVAAIAFLDPDMTVVGEQSFLAENIVMSPPVFHRGCVALARADVGRRSFVGNGAFVPGSCQLGDNSLIGVHSVAPARSIEPETTWLGSPVIFLPRRQQSERFPVDRTCVARRAPIVWPPVIAFFPATLPATIVLAALLRDRYVTIRLSMVLPAPVLVAGMPALSLGTGLALTLLVVVFKWL